MFKITESENTISSFEMFCWKMKINMQEKSFFFIKYGKFNPKKIKFYNSRSYIINFLIFVALTEFQINFLV